ncbi:conserved hypothetical protein [Methylomarinovum caldicuralii]|uniref:Spermatogenesis-associated protein 20-like TRX domain-containing protein n=1 Tax=Methylomarinovum caldicuralii TaxID=438856 RepID=A0AAU9CWH4_9GAMM|nr:DUF255 domain-containing protein [Methylomarinovum caldicuralii]BCX82327.1 conserved hypothetical protein [Methylomarinovum caldicuralii]
MSLPHAEGITYPAELQRKLQAALQAKGPGYRPRTRHLNPDGSPRYTNRLILEDSPYLLQHAHNPVDWYPWGPEAFAKAKREDKPVFLSIGYATCHWCHVMEEQSFEDPEIAAILNRRFVPVKVDREQRPDVDAAYMSAVQLLTGHGGWPLSAFLTPDGRLFFGGTYFPPGQFKTLLLRVAEAWKSRRREIEAQAGSVAEEVARLQQPEGQAEIDASLVHRAIDEIVARFDPRHGGFGDAPKFPNEPWLALLIDELWRSDDPKVLEVVRKTLGAMARGGLCDQVGGGFHRYSTDAAWQVPHFEKMLYNQAQLGRIYTHAAAITGDRFFERTARLTFDYVLRELTAPGGGFYSATDADSEGEEGKFFLWTPAEIRAALPPADAELAIEVFGITEAGNFEGKNVLHLPRPLAEIARARGMTEDELLTRLDHVLQRLYRVRQRRVPPLRDDKLVTAWNGMMIAALAEAARLLHEPEYLLAARRAADFLWKHHRRGGRLLRASLHGRAGGDGLQEDYAFLAEGLLALYDMSANPLWLDRARELAATMLAEFWDGAQGGFFMNRGGEEPLMVRPKDLYDSAQPSGNAAAARVLARLQRRAPRLEYRTRLRRLAAALGLSVRRSPTGFAWLLLALREFEQGETGPVQWAARGHVRVSGFLQRGKGVVWLRIADGWHLNGPEPGEDRIPTRLTLDSPACGWRLGPIAYPPPWGVEMLDSRRPLSLYQGRVELRFRANLGQGPLPLKLRLQACDDRQCLAPEAVRLQVPAVP